MFSITTVNILNIYMHICLTFAVSSSAVIFGSYGMGSPINVRSLTGNPPYTGTSGNLIRSYSDLNISNVKKFRGKGESRRRRRERGGDGEGDTDRQTEIIL